MFIAHNRFLTRSLASLVLACAFASTAAAKAFVLPHVLEKSGTINTTQFTFDTQLFLTYSGGLAGVGSGPTVGADCSLYLFDTATGHPLLSATSQEVCNPCTFTLGTGANGVARKQSIRIDDLITAKGGFTDASQVMHASGVMQVTGDADNVAIDCFVVNSHTSAFDLSECSVGAHEIGTAPCPPVASTKRVFVLPHVLEKSGTISNTQFTFDSDVLCTYGGGLSGVPGGNAQVQLYLYDNTGAVMRGSTSEVCNPCIASLDATTRTHDFKLEDLITTNGGGFDAATKLGFGIAVVGGADPDGVNIQGFVVNSHTSPFDLSVFGFDPQPIVAAPTAGVPDQSGLVRSLRGSPNPARSSVEFALDLERGSDVDLALFDTAGRRVATIFHGHRAAGPGTVQWNGRDAAGAKLASGVYFARLSGADGSRLTKVVYLPN